MAGQTAQSQGLAIVDEVNGKVKDGGLNINETRDMIANLKILVDARFIGKITRGTGNPPTDSNNGDIYLKMV
jgi:hypothetical protein